MNVLAAPNKRAHKVNEEGFNEGMRQARQMSAFRIRAASPLPLRRAASVRNVVTANNLVWSFGVILSLIYGPVTSVLANNHAIKFYTFFFICKPRLIEAVFGMSSSTVGRPDKYMHIHQQNLLILRKTVGFQRIFP